MTNGSPLIRLKGVKKDFGKKQVLDNISLDIRQNEVFGIIGASGSGKTTLLRLIGGFLQAENGNVLIAKGDKLRQRNFFFNKEIGFATQDSSFYPDLTVAENLRYFASLYNIHEKVEERMDVMLKLVRLKDEKNHFARNLSDGMKKRLDLACALMHNPKILILDEPTANIDITLKKQVWDLIDVLKRRGTTIILSSHHLGEVEALCDRIAIIHNKKIVAVGTADEIKMQFSVKRHQTLDNVFENIARDGE